NTPGSYDVTLIASNANGSDTLSLANYITVFPYPPPQGISQNGDTLFANQGAVSYQWYFNGNIISAATNYFYVAQASGDFNVVATDGNGCEVEAVIFNVIASVQAAEGSGSVQVFPNPVMDKFTIQNLIVTSGTTVEISICNMLGEKIFEREITTSEKQLDISFLQSGIYLLRIETAGKIFDRKLVKM
ncbi:MAG: T9SS type A sorting domain-containing protein, partial [Bacteroidetes bacterium]|nr:T9SS type A sorting domain-containing protein [Bacteroidota bacterium]